MSVKDINNAHKASRINEKRTNNQGMIMTIIEYNNAKDIFVEFDDRYKTVVHTNYANFSKGKVKNPNYKLHNNKNLKEIRVGQERLNNQGYIMRIIAYNNSDDIIVEFQDKYKALIHTTYKNWYCGKVENPYGANVFGVGITGNKYSTQIKEYKTWVNMISRCFSEKEKGKHPTYKDVTCCEEWLFYENFYEWLHSQENFDKWYNGEYWNVDKDILIKGNKIYSPEACCLVPHVINALFIKCNKLRGDLPIGVYKHKNKFVAKFSDPYTNKSKYIGSYETSEDAFQAYKNYKENLIKQMAQEEYRKGNITKKCYDTMMNYQVEITD